MTDSQARKSLIPVSLLTGFLGSGKTTFIECILGEQKPVLSTADTKIQSPYNTYVNKGLPPTPICSPGIESIDAALWPETTDYLFFLAKGDGSHVFSVTYEEHIRNKAKYIDQQ